VKRLRGADVAADFLGFGIGGIRRCDDSGGMTNPASSTRTDRIHARLTQAFAPTVLQIQDDSDRHAGHAGAQAGGESHYSVMMVSSAFHGVSRVARSRAVHEALAAEFGSAVQGGMHALALTLRTPEEHAAQTGR
jgi:BolA protein